MSEVSQMCRARYNFCYTGVFLASHRHLIHMWDDHDVITVYFGLPNLLPHSLTVSPSQVANPRSFDPTTCTCFRNLSQCRRILPPSSSCRPVNHQIPLSRPENMSSRKALTNANLNTALAFRARVHRR